MTVAEQLWEKKRGLELPLNNNKVHWQRPMAGILNSTLIYKQSGAQVHGD